MKRFAAQEAERVLKKSVFPRLNAPKSLQEVFVAETTAVLLEELEPGQTRLDRSMRGWESTSGLIMGLLPVIKRRVQERVVESIGIQSVELVLFVHSLNNQSSVESISRALGMTRPGVEFILGAFAE